MIKTASIITISLSPAWDITCKAKDIKWGQHKILSSLDDQPAGKALNVSKALAWMGQKNTACGLWGQQDYKKMILALNCFKNKIKLDFTITPGQTRKNITVIDSANNKEIHLRSQNTLATKQSLKKLKDHLNKIVTEKSICVISGSMPPKNLLDDVISIIKTIHKKHAKIVLDSSGPALKKIINTKMIWLIKPNLEELCQLTGKKIPDNIHSIKNQGHKLLDKVNIALISRGKKGAIAVTKDRSFLGASTEPTNIVSTVGCGDYLLAGFIKGLKDTSDLSLALDYAIKAAVARASKFSDTRKWQSVKEKIKVTVKQL